VKSKLSTAKKSKTTTFSRIFHPKKSTIFSGNFWTKNEDFEQCEEEVAISNDLHFTLTVFSLSLET